MIFSGFGRLQLLDYRPRSENELNAFFDLARDHLKTMRSAVVGLDDARRKADKRPKAHSMNLMVDKWRGAVAGPRKSRGPGLVPLFTPKVSTTGSGFGLTVVADFVAGAFGLQGRSEALRERYIDAVLEGNTFRIWFHWPIANQSLPPKLGDYHNPAQSLSEP